jgi:asparagine synthetase B (glutamine-hydrolysing)
VVHKTKGEISYLESTLPSIKGTIGIGHIRWATHGAPTTINAHPHISGNIAVVHNGIIENYQELKERLIMEGYVFVSETDTEVLAHLIHGNYKGDILLAVANALKEVKGSYGIAVLCGDDSDHLVGARKGSPLVVGLGEEENFIASDILAFLKHTKRVVFASDFELVSIKGSKVAFFNSNGQIISKKVETIEWDLETAELFGKIEVKAKKFCEDSHRTPFEKISRSTYENVNWMGGRYWIEAEDRFNRLSPVLRSMCAFLPEESRGVICSQIDEIEEADLPEKAKIIGSALSGIHVGIENMREQIENMREQLDERDRWIEYLKDLVLKRLDTINYGVFKLKLRSGEIVPELRGVQTELNKLETIKTDLKNIGLSLTDLGNLQYFDLHISNEGIARLDEEIESKIIPRLPETSDTQRVIEKLQDLKQSRGEHWFYRVAALSSIISLILTIL